MMGNIINNLYTTLDEYVENIIIKELGELKAPIDIEQIINNYGIDIRKKTMNSNQDGAIKISADTCIMIINDADAEVRQRFTMAHEFGHFISYHLQGKTGEITEFRDGKSLPSNDEEEIFANRFAAAILIPRTLLNNSTSISASKFNVSDASFMFRIKNL